ncbi:ATP-dependent zinc metalloprotease FtsH [Skermanella sp. TT6]|uniref:ATP-dependent zinc metalloprotease FtsH n=1 Tax=Skermanella cutis TaxID=2775420 RepID=A0ABX7B9D1_9PROT|nr:ATP-dependent zinc metalloprotease FtsH [Skermanella sp. TT6]QQP89686.1 ATP-dependent zinc metalloprotease FtsH [Skermanella sp. TT6]
MKTFLKRHARVIAIVAALVVTGALTGGAGLAYVYASGSGGAAALLSRIDRQEVGQSEFADRLAAGRIASLAVAGNRIEFTDRDGVHGVTTVLWTDALRQAVAAPGIPMTVEPTEGGALLTTNRWLDVLLKLNMVGFLAFALVFMVSMMRSPVKKAGTATSHVRFSDVAGVDEARAELTELVDFLKHPGRFKGIGAGIPKGVLLVGPPGTGKTLLARAVAGEAGVPFYAVTGSDFVEMYVGVGAARIRRLFRDARKRAPCILFIDEIDALARARGATSPSGGQIETENTLNQLLAEMDGFARASGLIVIAATNRVDVLDPAIVRPGRFDRHVFVGNPDIKGRAAILAVHAARVALDSDVDLTLVARGTPGMSGADLANLVNEAALRAARAGRALVSMADFEQARDKIVMGGEKATVMSEDERRLTAFHEAGHALVAWRSRHSDPVHKVTIVPRGRSLGMMVRLPLEDRFCLSRARLEAELDVTMGGRAAEEIVFGRDFVTTGAAGDIQMATDIATKMVTTWGMSDRFGMVAYGGGAAPAAATAARSPAGEPGALSPQVAEEVRGIIDAAYRRAYDLIAADLPRLHELADGLLRDETLDAAAVRAILERDADRGAPPSVRLVQADPDHYELAV